jgi:hypothetical protein
MVQAPQFRTIADHILEQMQVGSEKPFQRHDRLAIITTQLLQIWNARGEADIRQIEEKLMESMDATRVERLVESLGDAMHLLDL